MIVDVQDRDRLRPAIHVRTFGGLLEDVRRAAQQSLDQGLLVGLQSVEVAIDRVGEDLRMRQVLHRGRGAEFSQRGARHAHRQLRVIDDTLAGLSPPGGRPRFFLSCIRGRTRVYRTAASTQA